MPSPAPVLPHGERSAPALALVFAVLFAAYQIPEGLGMRVLHSLPIQALLIILFLPIAWRCGRALGFRGLDAWYLGLTPGWLVLLASCFALSVAAKSTALGTGALAGVYKIAPAPGVGAGQALMAALELLAMTFFPSIAEDIVTRGFLMRAFPRLAASWAFVPASAALFVLNHIYRWANGPTEWLMVFCFGLAYAAALYCSGTLWAALGLHWGWNFAAFYADRILVVDARPGQGPLVSSAAHLAMLCIVVLGTRAWFRPAPGGVAKPTLP